MQPKAVKYSAICALVALIAMIFGLWLFPMVLRSQLRKEKALSKKTDMREMWEALPFALDYKIYLFNYTNPDEIMKGAIPIVKEVGPYYFEEWKEKVLVAESEANDTISFKRNETFYFRQDQSGPGLTGEEIITMPNIFLMGLVTNVYRDKPKLMNMVGKAINGIFDNPPDVFMHHKALDIMFRGIMINCSRTELAPKAACTAIKKEKIAGLVHEPNNQMRFSLFGYRNATPDTQVITVKRGIQNVSEVGRVISIDDWPTQKIWRDHCNDFNGTDSTIFPPFVDKEDRLNSYYSELCRTYRAWFTKKSSYRGINTHHYVVTVGDLANDPDLQCFCDTPDTCPPKGIMDLKKCMGGPIYTSLPHFLDCDPEVQKSIIGLTPDWDIHGIHVDFEPLTGTPMNGSLRLQFSMQLLRTDKVAQCKNLPNSIVPLFWVDESGTLNKTYVNKMKIQLFIPKLVIKSLSWFLLVFGTLGALGGALYHNKDIIFAANIDFNATQVSPEPGEQPKPISILGKPAEPTKVDSDM